MRNMHSNMITSWFHCSACLAACRIQYRVCFPQQQQQQHQQHQHGCPGFTVPPVWPPAGPSAESIPFTVEPRTMGSGRVVVQPPGYISLTLLSRMARLWRPPVGPSTESTQFARLSRERWVLGAFETVRLENCYVHRNRINATTVTFETIRLENSYVHWNRINRTINSLT